VNYTAEALMKLLPAVYRIRDDAQGGSLAGLMDILAGQAQVVDGDIAQLYENWFIETCQEWVVPYIGDLLGVKGLHSIGDAFSQRARVANTLLYRQRKGTAAMLEQLARDTTLWPAKVLEFFRDLETTQFVNHRRLGNLRTPDLRNVDTLELLDSPFDSIAHTADVRHIYDNRGRYNIPNIGVFLWRLQSYFVPRSRARAAAAVDDGRYFFNPLRANTPLFNRPQTETDVVALAVEIDVPGMLRRRPLYEELEARRQTLAGGGVPSGTYFGETPVVRVWLNGAEVLPEEIAICDLSDPNPAIPDGWPRPPAQKSYGGVPRNIKIGVDPSLGRLALPQGVAPTPVEVGYACGFSGDVGAGPYDRSNLLNAWMAQGGRTVSWQMGVTKNAALIAGAPNPGQLTTTLADAIVKWKTFANATPNAFGLITILDSDTYVEDLTGANSVDVPATCALAIVAADWPVLKDASNVPYQRTGDFVPTGLRPALLGSISVRGLAGAAKGELTIDGLIVNGNITVLTGDLGTLRLGHMSLVPSGSFQVNSSVVPATQNTELAILIQRSICGPVTLPDSVPALTVIDSIVASALTGTPDKAAITAKGSDVNIQTSTVLGTTDARTLEAGNSILLGVVTAVRRQTGCVRFSYVPDSSQTGRRYRCQPDLALAAETDQTLYPGIRLRLQPVLTSVTFGDPGYAQLALNCATEIRSGAEDGAEMGVFDYLKQPQRETNLRSSLDEYLRFGLEAGIFFVN
jgi:hypothetical protein